MALSLPNVVFGDSARVMTIEQVHHADLFQGDGGEPAEGNVDDLSS